MKQKIKDMILDAAKNAHNNNELPSSRIPEVEIEAPKENTHGDFSTNIAMQMASIQKMPPGKIAQIIKQNIVDQNNIIDKIEIAGPGFINFFIKYLSWHPVLKTVFTEGAKYGVSNVGKGEKIQIEFVSANPTGPLHVGHGRGAAVGDCIANILKFCGYDVQKEYYVNDSGRQINTLGKSVYLRYKAMYQICDDFAEDCYQGDYIKDLAEEIKEQRGRELLEQSEKDSIKFCAGFAADTILSGIKTDLDLFGVKFDNWFSEQTLFDSNSVNLIIKHYKDQKIIYENEGALWFKTSIFGDEKDRVVVRNNGQTTYFASDIAYHQDKFNRGFKRVVDVWGADHHGYIPRVSAFVEASGKDANAFKVILVQLVNLMRGEKQVAMSTRSGEFVTLRDVVKEVGRDAARFIFLMRHYESALDFDLELAKKRTNENPVFYVQYVHARISSIIRKGKEREIAGSLWNDKAVLLLKEPEEIDLIKSMAFYPEVVKKCAELFEPHHITYYLMNLASLFHTYYNKHRVLTEEPLLTHARIILVLSVKKVIKNGLALLGVSAPEKM